MTLNPEKILSFSLQTVTEVLNSLRKQKGDLCTKLMDERSTVEQIYRPQINEIEKQIDVLNSIRRKNNGTRLQKYYRNDNGFDYYIILGADVNDGKIYYHCLREEARVSEESLYVRLNESQPIAVFLEDKIPCSEKTIDLVIEKYNRIITKLKPNKGQMSTEIMENPDSNELK